MGTRRVFVSRKSMAAASIVHEDIGVGSVSEESNGLQPAVCCLLATVAAVFKT